MSDQEEDTSNDRVRAIWSVQKVGWSWLADQVRRLRLSRRLSSLEAERDRLFAELGKKAIELGISVDDPELDRELDQLEEDRHRISEKIREKEEEINRVRCRFDSKISDVDQRIDDLKERQEEQRQKLELNQISIDRAQDRRSGLKQRMDRAEQAAGEEDDNGREAAPQPVLEGPAPAANEDEGEDDSMAPDELADSIERTDRDLEELRNKRERLRNERASLEASLREKRKERKQLERKRDTELRRIETEIGDLERRLDDVDREKTTFARDLGRRLFEEERATEPLEKYVRRLDRVRRRIERTHDRLDDVQVRIEDVSALKLVRFLLPWLLVALLVGSGLYFLGA